MINFSALRPHTLAGKIVRFPFRAIPRDLAVPILQGPLRGKKWIVGSYIHGCWLGSYEFALQQLIASEVKRGDVFFDVGACVGFYSLLAAVRAEPGQVHAFEPLPANLVYLRKHLQLNKIKNVEVHEIAVSDEVGTKFFADETTRAMGKLDAKGGTPVRTSTIDALLQAGEIPAPNYIKMDIEGTESKALLGAQECILRHKPKLFLATHGRQVHSECLRILSSWRYEFREIARESADRAELVASLNVNSPEFSAQ
jgi:FkbM family methyltransferase